MSKCEDCKKEMLVAKTCDFPEIEINNKWHDRIPYGSGGEAQYIDTKEEEYSRCHDCGVKNGGIHHFGCDMEDCPVCGEQLFCCDCDKAGLRKIK